MLNFKEGKPIVQIIRGGKPKDIIYIDENSEDGSDMIKLKKICCKMSMIPNIENREVVYIAGPSGSGKTSFACEYIKMFKKLFPKNSIFVFSRLKEDKILDDLGIIRIVLDDDIIENPIDIHEDIDRNDLVMFDDTDTIQDIKIKNAVSRLKNDILETGRHNDIYILVTSHLINGNDRKDNRTILNEAHSLVFFPKSGSTYGINYVLKNYLGLSKKQIDEIISQKSRWVIIKKAYPQHVVTEKCVFTL